MKVLDIYNKDDLDLITYNGELICDLMDRFFSKYPIEYRKNYDTNIETLEMYRVDEMVDSFDNAQYVPSSNVLTFKSFAALPHEFMHMASADRSNKRFAICRDGEYSLYENGLVEGMTEYLSCVLKNGEPDTYFFEYFVVSMLDSIDEIFRPFFIPSYDEFIKLFPKKIDIVSLMYSLDFYHNSIMNIDDRTDDYDIKRVSESVKNVIDSLINIEISMRRNIKDKRIYGDKFMDLISNNDLESILLDVCPEYKDYAYHEIKKKLFRRIR